jgi:hypothetical protein
MRRRAKKLLLFLLAGAIINVAVAWGCAIAADAHTGITKSDRHVDQAGVWDTHKWQSFGSSLFHFQHYASKRHTLSDVPELVSQSWPPWLPNLQYAVATSEFVSDGSLLRYVAEARGFPLRSLGHELKLRPRVKFEQNGLSCEWKVRYGIIISPGSLAPRALPLRPIWPGFAINTIFYAAIVWMMFAVPGTVRRRVRIKRGQCASCGYSLRGRGRSTSGNDTCPECGAIDSVGRPSV